MANWKKVDADQLDADLTTVADAIRERAGISEKLDFPYDYKSAVEGVVDYSRVVEFSAITSFSSSTVVGTIRQAAFNRLDSLETVNLPNVTSLEYQAFSRCTALREVSIPMVKNIAGNVFELCTSLEVLDLPTQCAIAAGSFTSSGIKHLILRRKVVYNLKGAAFNSTPIANGTGYIYVPSVKVESYKAATNWSTHAAQFRALEDYTVDGTTTGALDESKI